MLAGKARDSLQEESRIAHVSYPRDCSGCVVARRFHVDACQQPFHPPAAAVCRDLAHHALCWRPQDRLKQAYPENIEAEPKARLQMLLHVVGITGGRQAAGLATPAASPRPVPAESPLPARVASLRARFAAPHPSARQNAVSCRSSATPAYPPYPSI